MDEPQTLEQDQTPTEPAVELDQEQIDQAGGSGVGSPGADELLLPVELPELTEASSDQEAPAQTPMPDLAGFAQQIKQELFEQHSQAIEGLKRQAEQSAQRYQDLLAERIRSLQTGKAFFRTGHEIYNKYFASA